MGSFYVTGGRQRKDAKQHIEWFSYAEASVVAFDMGTGEVNTCATHVGDPAHRPDDERANIVFKAGSRHGDRFVVCSQTEILTYSLPDFELVDLVTHPWFNDLHHVTLNDDGNFLVADTGLDLVLEVAPDGSVLKEYCALPDDSPWDRFERDTDFRKLVTTKPHHCHPNYVFEIGDELWVSRFRQRDLFCLTDPAKRIDVGVEKVHDGNLHEGLVYLTTVNGHIIVADPGDCTVLADHDLNAMTDTTKTLGWCRGLHVLDAGRVLVGFSRLRASKIRENLRWVKFQMGMSEDSGRLPTRVCRYDLKGGRQEWELDLEPHDVNAVFSIVPAD